MHPEEREKLAPQVWNIIRERQASPDNMVDVATLEPLFMAEGLRYADFGFASLRDFLNEFRAVLNLVDGAPAGGGLPAKSYVQLKDFDTLEATAGQKAEAPEQPLRTVSPEDTEQPELSAAEKAALAPKIQAAFQSAVSNEEGWVNLASLGALLKENGVDAKQLGFPKMRPFLEQFPELLELKHEPTASGKAWVAYARLREDERREGDGKAEKSAAKPHAPRANLPEHRTLESKFPNKDSWLFYWARIPNLKIKELAEKALAEKWYYGTANAADAENYPILKNYLAYTFKRLVFEDKILYGDVSDAGHAGEEYAAFNTGLVDQKYEYIYALFKKNTMSPQPYWYLLDFVVAGEQSGKTLARLFYPLPKRADYFENQFRNMVYDTSTQLLCDYTHIIVERIGRFPLRFLQENCPPNMLDIDGIKLEEVYPKHAKDSERKRYFEQLGERIRNTPMVLNNLKNRLEAAIHLTLKRVEWNYKTAIPVYFPTRNLCSLLLPLCLSEEGQVDLALVVEPLQSGAYQGQTVLPLDLAYNNSRLLTRPDSDWLRPDSIQSNGSDDEEE